MTWTIDDMPEQTGRVAIVTGATSGLGLESTRALARRGAHVVMAVRDLGKAQAVRAGILQAQPTAALEIVPLDLSDLATVHAAADAIAETHGHVDILLNNAGIMASGEGRTVDGFELQVGINHLGHFVLTARLLPLLARARAARVVAVTSTGRHIGRVLGTEDPYREGRYDPWRAYGDAKFANLVFAVELDVRLRDAGARVASLVAHPGLSATELQARSVSSSEGGRSQRFFHRLANLTGLPPERAVLPQLRAATDPRARGGQLYAPRFVNVGPPVRRPLVGRSRSRRVGRQLWAVSERETGQRFDVAASVGRAR